MAVTLRSAPRSVALPRVMYAGLPSAARPRPRLLLLGCVFRFLLPGAAQHAAQRVVAFVARVLVELLSGRVPGILAGPRAVPRRRIVDGEPVEQRPRAGAGEALDDVQLVARSLELC